MKKFVAILVAALLVFALSVGVFAEEIVVFNNPDGEVPTSCEDPWGSFGVAGDTWGRGTCCDISLEDLIALFEQGGYTLSYVYGGSPATWGDTEGHPAAVLNAGWEQGVRMNYTEIGDGKWEASVALDDVLAGYDMEAGAIEALAIQNWAGDFKLYSAKFTNGADTVAAAPAPEAPAASAPAAPSTGLALAVVPAVMALAAVAVSKKH